MRILLTGASSFSGLWFARMLAEAGHTVLAALRSSGYEDALRLARAERAAQYAELVSAAPFGSEAFVELISSRGPFDVLCHHGAEAAGHKRPDFDVEGAVKANTWRMDETLAAFKAAGGARLVITGSVFEQDEGRGEAPLRAFSPYGLSKTLTSRAFAQGAERAGLAFVKFVIPNPFGPFEAQTFQRHVMTAWREGRVPRVTHPFYERDNVPVGLLARVYAAAAEGRLGGHVAPSFYAGPVGDFFRRMAREVAPRAGWACGLELADSQSFEEPKIRTNTQPIDPNTYDWVESRFWDAYARYYAGGG
jgi:nucleoside-diphosphate-sugar epimerase